MFISNFFVMSLYSNTISGIILNEKKQPIEFANITLFKTKDSLPISTTLSDSFGVYTFLNLAENNYSIEISYLGYITDTIKNISIKDRIDIINIGNRIDTIIVQDNEIQLNEIQLKLSSTTLTEVQVTATKTIYERKADRIIFNVENSVYSQVSDAMQVLSKAPRVQTTNNEIKIAGRGNAAVLINDRLVRMSGEELSQYLKSIPSTDIQKIEVIPNPPAKYDAQGAALINFVLKKNKKQGYNGSVGVNYLQAKYAYGNGFINLNYRKNKYTFKASINGGKNKFYNVLINEIKYQDEIWKSDYREYSNVNYLRGTLALDIEIDKKNSIGFYYNAYFSKYQNSNEDNRTNIFSIQDDLKKYLINEANNTNIYNQHIANINYTHVIDTLGKKLEIGVDFLNSYSIKNRNYSNKLYNNLDSLFNTAQFLENTNGKQKSSIYSTNLDVTYPVKYGIWKYGAKFTLFNIKSNNEQAFSNDVNYIIDTSQSNIFQYKENTTAIYGSYSKVFKKIELQIGLRLEYTHLKGVLINYNQENKQNYLKAFPSLSLSYQIKKDNQLNFVVNSRIDRPNYSMLNPFRNYTNQYEYKEGNPFLKPLNSYNFSLEYVLKERYTFSIYYGYHKNNVSLIYFTDSTSKNYFERWVSDRDIHDLGTYNQFKFSVKERWDINVGIDAFVDFLKSPYLFQTNKKIYWSMHLDVNNDIILDKRRNFTLNVNYVFKPPGRSNGEYTKKVYNQLDIGLKAVLLKNKQLVVSLSANNIFKSYLSFGYGYNTSGQYIEYKNYFDDRRLALAVSYKFGNNKIKFKNKQMDNTDIKRVTK